MEDIGDIIYIFVLIIFAIVGTLGKRNKKKAQEAQQAKPRTPSTVDPWEEFERQFREATESVSPKPEPVKQHDTTKQRKTYRTEMARNTPTTTYHSELEQPTFASFDYDTIDDGVSRSQVKKQIKENVFKRQTTLRTTDVKTDIEPVYNVTNVSFDNPEDAKIAFIYAEIFNRKYQ